MEGVINKDVSNGGSYHVFSRATAIFLQTTITEKRLMHFAPLQLRYSSHRYGPIENIDIDGHLVKIFSSFYIWTNLDYR
jgi:hypothetical protein